jgi:hypothetical protein
METKKNFAVRVYDTTCNDCNHESQLFNTEDYSWVDDTLVDTECAYNMSKEEAEALKAKFEAYAKARRLDWVTFQVEELPLTYDVVFNDDADSNSKGWEQTYDYCLSYIRMYNGTNESYFKDYKNGVVSIYCNETDEEVYQEIIK